MALSIVKLRREYEIRTWRKIIEENPYVAVVQSTGGKSWGRTNMKARILGKHLNSKVVGARYAIPRAAREAALQTRFDKLSSLFQTAGSAVVYGQKVDPVVEVVKNANDIIDGSLLLGGRFGDDIVTAKVWETVLDSKGESTEWANLVSVLDRTPPFITILDRSSSGLVEALKKSGRAHQLTGVLQRMETDGKTG